MKLQEAYETYALRAKRLAFVISGDEGLAEDVTQEAFLRLATHLRHIRRQESMWPYLRSIVINLVRSHYRRASRENRALQLLDRRRHPSRPSHEDRVVMDQTVSTWLRRLPPKQRVALVLFYLDDMPTVEIAQLMHTTEGTIRSWLSRGVGALRGASDDEEHEHDYT
jgi:RNA polymerase sigma-70 factor (ECF subfamily)